jgi:hypothetical protein
MTTRGRIQIQALVDQVWADLAQYSEAIERVAEEGPESEEDVLLMRKVCCAVIGELHLRETRFEGDLE